jgi:hypothetical protein
MKYRLVMYSEAVAYSFVEAISREFIFLILDAG